MLAKKTIAKFENIVLQHKLIGVSRNLKKPKSAIFYTTHKCASTFMAKMFAVILKNSDYDLVNYASVISQLGDRLYPGINHEIFLEKAYSELYFLHGKIYAPQRNYLDFPGRNKFKHIFFLRDPRDVLVSAYYSFGFTHKEPKNSISRNNFIERRDIIQKQEIDDYVLENAEKWIIPLYKQYKELRETSEAFIYLKYNTFTENTPKFIEEISDFLELHPSKEEIKLLTKEASPVQDTESMKHKRSGKSGQYLEKLEPNTIEKLNHLLSEILLDWEFES